MENKNYKQLLREPDLVPDEDLFSEVLSKQLFDVYKEILKIISEFGLVAEWKYYHDGKSWLWKVSKKKKTIVWISLWEEFFKSSFYFTEKNHDGLLSLDIDNKIKDSFSNARPIGRLIPLTMDIEAVTELENLKKIITYKISQK